MRFPFADRREAGRLLADRLKSAGIRPDLVLALPRGGVPVALEVALVVALPLDVFLVRKLGAPGQPELAMGAIASGGSIVLNESVVEALGVTPSELDRAITAESAVLRRREREYRGDAPPLSVAGLHVLLVDDGLATGASMRAAVAALRAAGAARITVGVPVGAAETCGDLAREVDSLVCLAMPEPFVAVGRWYDDFRPVSDGEVRDLLARGPRGPTVPVATRQPEDA